MLTSTVALLALLTPAFASPIDRRAPANPVIPAHLRRRAPALADTVFNPNSSALDNAKYIPLNPKRTPRVKPSATSTTNSWTEAWTSVSTASTTTNQPTSTTPWTSVAPSATSTGWVSPFDLSWKAQGWSFFDSFNGFPYDDPTHGSVNYGDIGQSWDRGLLAVTESTALLRVDNTSRLASGVKRNSVRITSKQKVSLGSLVVLDVKKAPWGKSTWPAMWSVGDNWPAGGEIDIFEGVNNVANNQMTLHTSPGCTLYQPMNASGTVLDTNCDAMQNYNTGCGVMDASSRSYGESLTKNGGGVFVMYMDESGISIWFFLASNIPDDIRSDAPAFRNWGLPRARFDATSCDMAKYFADQTLVINITLCGDWAGSTSAWSAAGYSGSCAEAVMDPTNFDNAVFEFNSVKVFTPK